MSNTRCANVTQEKNRVQKNEGVAADPRVAFWMDMLAAAGLRMESFTDEPGLFRLVASA